MVTPAPWWVMGWEPRCRQVTAPGKVSDLGCRRAGFLLPGAAGAGGTSPRPQETGAVLAACLNPSSAPLLAKPL